MIDFIDINTLYVSLVVISLFMGVVLLYLGRLWSDTIKGVTGIGLSLIVIAITLTADILLHSSSTANAPSTIASGILVIAFYCMYRSISQFRKKPTNMVHHIFILVPGLLLLFYLGYIADLLTIRIIVFSALFIFYASATGIRFIQEVPTANKSAYIHMGVFFFLFAGMNLFRIISIAFYADKINLFQDTLPQVVYLIFTMLIILLACTSFIMLVNKELAVLKEQITSIMAHDLKNPLATIMSYSDILKEDDVHSKEDKQLFLSLIYDAAGSSLDMINNMMEWTRLSFGKTIVQSRNVNIKHLVNDLIKTYQASAELKHLSINTSLSENCIVHSDPLLINTVLRNLFSNAIKYSPENDEISIRCNNNGNHIQIDFLNNGPQVNQELIANITNKKIMQGTIEKGKEGSGLGLFLCAQYLNMLDGRLKVENQAIGCKFSIILPEKETKSEDLIL